MTMDHLPPDTDNDDDNKYDVYNLDYPINIR